VVIDKLHRLSGDPAIPPSDDVKKAAGDRALATAIVRLCLAVDGTVESTKIVKSSGVPVYDDQLQGAIKATWKFSPVDTDGKPGRVCTSVAFVTNR
jgi:TonB family protein